MRFFILLASSVYLASAFAAGNTTNDSFQRAKRRLAEKVYFDNRVTFYCSAPYDKQGNIRLPEGFVAAKHPSRASKIEWEHIVPAENFGRNFVEWREGAPSCVDRHGKAFKTRNCAEKANLEYRYMQADMHNLAPAIGAVNAARQNYNFAPLPHAPSAFGTCPMKIEGKRVEPPEAVRGMIARTYLYMEAEYPRYKMGKPQKQLMKAWNKTHPPTPWECTRARRIAKIQGNVNQITEARCKEIGR